MKCLLVLLPFICLASASENLVDCANAANLTTFTSFVNSAGLTDVLREQGPFTLIVPTNEAFAKLPPATVASLQKDSSALANVLQYHVVKGSIYSWDMVSGEILSSLNGHYIRVYSQGSSLYFNQAKVTKVDLQCSNGVIYLVDEVLNVPEGTIVDVIKNPDYNISGFMEFLEAAKLTDVFNRTSSQRYTMFVPTNAAIASLDADYITKLKSSYIYARHIVDYHVHPGTIHEKSLDHAGTLSTMYRGHSISVTVDSNNNPVLNHAATLQVTDIEAENGVVHIISHVLIPSTLNPGVVG
ncbi:Hypothetical predicted protein [Mytilus galloprovincialis]|uniref:FAS1 domain-containing protein n=1 Tax=Mytilus galloprovincialis TaxID=29158 RepID=A0A8B6E270_MYTGA|nr:Hypothetical predicted protein [Mytilus galloprovincialis]